MCTTEATKRLQALRDVPAFRGLPNRTLRKIDALVDEVSVPAGFTLTKEGEPGRQSFIVISGQAEVAVDGRQAAVVGPGSFVGEMAMLDFGPRSATVQALTPMRLLVVGPAAFATLMEVPAVAVPLVRDMAGRLRGMVEERYAAA